MRFLEWTFAAALVALLAIGTAKAAEEHLTPWQQALAPVESSGPISPAAVATEVQPQRLLSEAHLAPMRPVGRSQAGAPAPFGPPDPVPEEIAEFDVDPVEPAPPRHDPPARPSPLRPEHSTMPPPPGRLPGEPAPGSPWDDWGLAEVGDSPFVTGNACDPRGGFSCGHYGCVGDGPLRLIDHPALGAHRVEVGGWFNAGISAVANNPADRFKGPVTFNDRHGEAQMNQLWLFAAREADTGGYGLDWGGRVDLLYGTDARFTRSAGLEERWGDPERFYQLALPQLYLDVALNHMTVRMGHFFTILGYERVQAPANFFYSHSYAHQYAEPFTHTGMLAMWDLSDQWSLAAGFHRGADQFEDLDGLDALGFLGGVSWTSRNERLNVAFGLNANETGHDATLLQYSLVATLQVTERLRYVFQHDYVQETDKSAEVTDFAEGYGINQYLLYDLNACWSGGLRVEWFRDQNGRFVAPDDPANVASQGGFAGSFSALTLGLNYKPNANLAFRPEVRWDGFSPSSPGVPRPFDAGDRNRQFSYGLDMILHF